MTHSRLSTFIKNTSWLSLAELGSKCFKFFLIPFAARILGPSDFGLFSYLSTLLISIFLLSDIGLNALYILDATKKTLPQKTLLATLFALKFVLMTTISLLAWIILRHSEPNLAPILITILILSALFDQLKKLFFALYDTHLLQKIRSLGLLIETGTTTVIGILLLTAAPSILSLALAYATGSALSATLLLTYFIIYKPLKNATDTYKIDISIAKSLLTRSWPFFFTGFLQIILSNSDTLMIQWLIGPASVGHYQAALKLIQLGLIIPYLFNVALYPIQATLQNNPQTHIILIRKALRGAYLIGLPAILMGFLFAKPLFLFIFGANYAFGIWAFKILLLGLLIDFGLGTINNALFVVKQEKKSLLISSIAITLNILINIALIPTLGILGAAIGTLLAKSVDVFWSTRLLCKTLQTQTLRPHQLHMILLYAALPAITSLISYHYLTLIPSLSIGIIVYALLLLLSKDITLKEIIKNRSW